MVSERRQRGGVRFETIVWLVVLAVVALICWEAVPVKIRTAEFYDYMEDQAKFAANNPPEALKKEILRKAQELQIPVNEKTVTVRREGDNIRMIATYEIPLEFPFYTYVWKFDHNIFRPVFSV